MNAAILFFIAEKTNTIFSPIMIEPNQNSINKDLVKKEILKRPIGVGSDLDRPMEFLGSEKGPLRLSLLQVSM